VNLRVAVEQMSLIVPALFLPSSFATSILCRPEGVANGRLGMADIAMYRLLFCAYVEKVLSVLYHVELYDILDF
jgi:hypothetical protein